MKNLILSSAMVLIASSAAQAQQAVQWKVSEGGNGHWYRFVQGPSVPGGPNFDAQDAACAAVGGHMATLQSQAEWDFFRATAPTGGGYWIGLRSDRCTAWAWSGGEPLQFAAWGTATCGAGPYPNNCGADNLRAAAGDRFDCGWNWDDYPQGTMSFTSYCIEWSADCNGDGIVDYGQILDGTLGDVDDDGVPDVCDDPCPADLTDNGLVNGADLGLVLAAWGTNGADQAGSDINADGIVNGADLGLLLAAWGPCSTSAWATVISWMPDSSIVTDPQLRASIAATGQPWRVQDTATGIEMMLIPPGTFQMGCSPSVQLACAQSESPVHQVTLTRAYYLARYEVTQAQWMATMGSNPSSWPGADLPVNRVEREIIGVFLKATGMRLPTEAEWEWAYRAGTTTAFHGFDGQLSGTNDDTLLPSIAWYSANSGGQTHPVGGKPGNGFGLHDMSGNVAEWVQAWFADYPSTPQVDPTGPVFPPPQGCVVIRGGSWVGDANPARASARSACGVGLGELGFRVARNP